jgi:hypothetical protein
MGWRCAATSTCRGSRVTGALTTTASQSRSAAIWLCESHVGGRLLCVDTIIESGDGRAIQADRMKVGGTVRLIHDFAAGGEVRLLGARIDGSIDLTGARLADDNGLALELADAVVGGSIYLIGRERRRVSAFSYGRGGGVTRVTVDGVPHLQLTDRVLIFAERHLRRVLAKYAAQYNRQRPHRALQLRQPRPESPMPEPFHGKVRRRQVLGGLINEYKPAA